MRLILSLTTACVMAFGCGSADQVGLFGDPAGEPGHDASDVTDARVSSGGGSSASGGSAPLDGGVSGGGGSNGSGGVSNSGGEGGAPSSGGSSSGGNATGGLNGDGGACPEPKKWCRDRDRDGYGDPDESKVACESPGDEWKEACNDCRDDNALVHPDAECQEDGFTLIDGVAVSFDYDCDGHEDECGDFAKADTEGCGIKGPLSCAGSGYLPNPDRAAGADQNAYCGTTSYRNCVSVGIPCVAQTVTKPAVECH